MIRRAVVYKSEAEGDLAALYDYLANAASSAIAINFVRRLRDWLSGFDLGAERGTQRDDLQQGLRIVGFERRVAVAFVVEDSRVVILRVFYGGQDWGAGLSALSP